MCGEWEREIQADRTASTKVVQGVVGKLGCGPVRRRAVPEDFNWGGTSSRLSSLSALRSEVCK